MNNGVENDCFGFSKVKWLHLTGEVDRPVRCSCRICSGFNIQKLMKSVNFRQSYSKNKRWAFCGARCSTWLAGGVVIRSILQLSARRVSSRQFINVAGIFVSEIVVLSPSTWPRRLQSCLHQPRHQSVLPQQLSA